MSKHLLRVAAGIAVLVGGAMSFPATAAPHPSIRVKIVDSAQEPNLASPKEVVAQVNETTSNTLQPIATETKQEEVAAATPIVSKETVVNKLEVPDKVEDILVVAKPENVVPVTVSLPSNSVEPLAIVWRVDVSDGNVRHALARWAMNAEWIDLWELDIDIPLTASATIATTPNFREAVQSLADAVALSEAPFRPCFYSNNVVRIVPYNAMCDRTAARSERG